MRKKNGAFIQDVLNTFTQADALTQSQRQESITLLAKTMGLPEPVIASYLDHRPQTTITPVDAHVAARCSSKPQISSIKIALFQNR